MLYKGLIFSLRKNTALVATPNNAYYKIARKATMFVGQEVIFKKTDIIDYKYVIKKLSTIAACVCLLITIAFVFVRLQMQSIPVPKEFAFISLDINPSMEFTIDELENVLNVESLSNDAEEITKEIEFKGMKLDSAVTRVVELCEEKEFIDTKSKVYLLIGGSVNSDAKKGTDKAKSNDKLSKILNELKESLEKTYSGEQEIIAIKSSPENREAARENNISQGKYAVYSELIRLGKEITVEEIKGTDMKDLLKAYIELNGSVTASPYPTLTPAAAMSIEPTIMPTITSDLTATPAITPTLTQVPTITPTTAPTIRMPTTTPTRTPALTTTPAKMPTPGIVSTQRPTDNSVDGYALGTTGGAGGTSVTVANASDLILAAGSSSKMIITVSGSIDLGATPLRVKSDKTIQGKDSSSTIKGNISISNVSNVIIKNLNITNPSGAGSGDGIEVSESTKVFITKCTFTDCADGSLDIVRGSDYVTVSWCRFRDNTPSLIGNGDNVTTDAGKLHVTMHHNWYDSGCKQRMPRVRYGQVHLYNNYYGASGSDYNVGVGVYSQILVENCYFDNQRTAWNNMSTSSNQGEIQWNSGNEFVSTSIPTWAPNSDVFDPPYSYTLDPGSNVKSIVTAGAGNR
ncbi:MAG: anti-sigma-I factor RsgI family protein [Bacillota bacterium]